MCKFELFVQPEWEAVDAWNRFQDSPMQRALHNTVVKKICEARLSLEEATPENVLTLQADIRALKLLFGIIHRNDPLLTK